MNYLEVLRADLEKGFTKADLERLIGLPKNNLSGVLKGDKKLSRKSELKIELWEASEKPNPLELKYQNRIEDLAAGRLTDADMGKTKRMPIEFTNPMHEKAQAAIYNSTHTDSHLEVVDVPIGEISKYVNNHGLDEGLLENLAKESKEGVSDLITQYEQELTTLPEKGQFAIQRRKWLKTKIYHLKNNQQ